MFAVPTWYSSYYLVPNSDFVGGQTTLQCECCAVSNLRVWDDKRSSADSVTLYFVLSGLQNPDHTKLVS